MRKLTVLVCALTLPRRKGGWKAMAVFLDNKSKGRLRLKP